MILDNTDDFLDTWQIKRRDRLRYILKWLEKKKKVSLKEYFGFAGVELGIHRNTAHEYLRDLQLWSKIMIKKEWIIWKENESNN